MDEINGWELIAKLKTSIAILTIGASGTGKSALINGLVGKDVAKEGRETLFAETRRITHHNVTKKDTIINIWDSPGMDVANISGGIELEKIVTDIQNEVREVDLVLFCINMTSARLRRGDSQNIAVMIKAFGELILKNAVFVLTFANQVKPPPSRKGIPPIDYFNERLSNWKSQIQDALKNSNVPDEIAESIKIVPAGYYDELSLPGRYNWFSDFWHTCYEVTKDGAQAVLLQVNLERLKTEVEFRHTIPLKDQMIESRHFTNNPSLYGAAGGVLGGLAAGGIIGGSITTVGAGAVAGAACGFCYYGIMRYRNKEPK